MSDNQVAGSSTKPAEVNVHQRLGEEWILSDISRALELRRDYYKYTIGVATALLAFTVSFPPTLTEIAYQPLVLLSWPLLGLAILCGIVVHYVWAWFFISFRDLDNNGKVEEGIRVRRKLNYIRRAIEVLQILCLSVGVLGIATFAAANFVNVKLS